MLFEIFTIIVELAFFENKKLIENNCLFCYLFSIFNQIEIKLEFNIEFRV